jgi:Domain of unknown function (DUF4412)
MKYLRLTFVFTLLAMFPFQIFGQGISFVIHMESKNMGGPAKIEFAIMGQHTSMNLLMDGRDENIRIIFDYGTMQQTTLINSNEQKIAMVAPIKDIPTDDNNDISKQKITKTDEKRVINGYNCTKYIVKGDDGVSDVWTTTEVKYTFEDVFKSIQNFNGQKGKDNEFIESQADIGGFPIEIYAKNKKGSESMKMTISEIKQGEVDESLFSIDGYQVVDAASMMK